MSISQIQNKTFTGSGTTITFSSTPTAGNLVTVNVGALYAFDVGPGQSLSVSDNKGNTYSALVSITDDLSLDTYEAIIAVYRAFNISTGSSFTITLDSSAFAQFEGSISEWSGIITTDPDDTINSTQSSSTTSDPAPGSITTTTQNSLVIAAAWVASPTSNINFGSPAGYTNLRRRNSGTTTLCYESDYKILTTIGTENPTISCNNAFQTGWAAVIGSMKGVGSTIRLFGLLGVG